MSGWSINTKKCPFCFEEVKEDALKCKHCHSDLIHTKKCTHCSEIIKKEAEKCKYCHSGVSM
jgi:RNA polymerase subunit RPABC4/transcription elongation factor Spt4